MKYIALSVVAFAAGAELGLTKDQASARRHALTKHPKTKDWYVATGPVQLKAGEEFHYDGDLPKGMAESVEALKKARAAKAEADAAAKAEAIATAEKALSEAEAALAAAADDETKAVAQAVVDKATAELAALKA